MHADRRAGPVTRKQRRKQARARRAELVGAVQRTWLKQLGIVAAIIVLILFADGCSSSQGSSRLSRAQPQVTGAGAAHGQRTDAEVASLLAGIPQRGNILGNPKAPVTVQYFGDLECPSCRRFTLGVLPSLIQSYVRRGNLKIEYRSLETATHNPETFRIQQVAALAAGRQNKMWDFIDLFYHEQGQEGSAYVSERYLRGLAQRVTGLDLIGWTVARGDPELIDAITSDARAASNAGIRSTPTFLLAKARNTPYVSAIEQLLRG
jgi:protein-disulfide isomerase